MKGTYILVSICTVLAMAGCVSTSKVTPAANGLYTIKGRANGPFNADKETTKGLKKANEFCAKQSKHAILHDINTTGHAALLGEHVLITFECEA